MKNIKQTTLMTLAIASLAITSYVNAENVFSSAWNKTKSKASELKSSTKQKWSSLDDSTKNIIIGTGAAALGTGAAVGLGYAGYKGYDKLFDNKGRPIVNDPTQDKATLDQVISFLTKDPQRKGNPQAQKSYINTFDISEDRKKYIFDMVQREEQMN